MSTLLKPNGNGSLGRVLTIAGVTSLVSLGVGFGINYQRITGIEKEINRGGDLVRSVAVLESRVNDLSGKIEQLQKVVIDMRDVLILRKTNP